MVISCTCSVDQMLDATFTSYGGGGVPAGYHHGSGGGVLVPGDYDGLSALLLRTPEPSDFRGNRLRAALEALNEGGNQIVRDTLTCLERLRRDDPADRFPREAGGPAAMPSVPEVAVGASMARADDDDVGAVGGLPNTGPSGPGGLDVPQQGLLTPTDTSRFTGALSTVNEIDPSSSADRNAIHQQVAGTIRERANAEEERTIMYNAMEPGQCAENAVNTVLYPKGEGGRLRTRIACSAPHHRKLRLAGANDRFANAIEFVWYHFQETNKRALHSKGAELVNSTVARGLTKGILHDHSRATNASQAAVEATGLSAHVTATESLTGGVSKTVVGGKAYWKKVGPSCCLYARIANLSSRCALFRHLLNSWRSLVIAEPRNISLHSPRMRWAGTTSNAPVTAPAIVHALSKRHGNTTTGGVYSTSTTSKGTRPLVTLSKRGRDKRTKHGARYM